MGTVEQFKKLNNYIDERKGSIMKKHNHKRKVIQITTSKSQDALNQYINESLYALCDDGTVWRYNWSKSPQWIQVEQVPQCEIDD